MTTEPSSRNVDLPHVEAPLTIHALPGPLVNILLGNYQVNELTWRAIEWYARQCDMEAGTGHLLVAAHVEAAISDLIVTALRAFTAPRPLP